MKLVMTLLVRDEEDILEANIRYHLARGVDFIVATDNRSVDGTRAILERYRERGVLHLIEEQGDDYEQSRWVTRMARMACTDFGADWVINNDADEFWWPESAPDLKTLLDAVPEGTDAVQALRSNFTPRPARNGVPFFETMTLREKLSLNAAGRPQPSKVCHRGFPDIIVAQGNHRVRRPDAPLVQQDVSLTILHFPVRSYRQFAHKIEVGGAAYERNRNIPHQIGIHWRMLYEKLRQGELPAWYSEQELDEVQLQAALRDGSLVTDTRLRDFIRSQKTADGEQEEK